MDIPSYLLGKKAGGGGGGATYTAGTNIEITSENVINNTIPYKKGEVSGFGIGESITTVNRNALLIGTSAAADVGGLAIGLSAGAGKNTVNVGGGPTGQFYEKSVIVGVGASASSQSIAIGYGASASSANQAMLGSNSVPINQMKIYTSNGAKNMATEEYVNNAISTAITSALGGNY